jgi:hypothetical protein
MSAAETIMHEDREILRALATEWRVSTATATDGV